MNRLLVLIFLAAIILIAGCVGDTGTPDPEGVAKPTDREFEIAQTFHDKLWEDETVPEDEIRATVAARYGISEDELITIYAKVITYQMETTGQTL